MDEQKLRIPGPDEPEDLTRLDNVVFYGLMICLLIAGLIAIYTKHHASRADIRSARSEAPEPPRTRLEAKQRELVAQYEEDFDAHQWKGDDVTAALRYGPREAAEAACRDALADADELPRSLRIELVALMSRGAEHAPWTCLLRAYLDGQLTDDDQLYEQMEVFWEQTQSFRAPPGISASIVESFHQRGHPDSEAYRDWLHVCAFQTSAPGHECRTSLQTLGGPETLLGTYDAMVSRTGERDTVETAMGRSMAGLSSLAKTGELDGWTRPENVSRDDVRVGALFWMCRLAHSSRTKLAWTAAEALSDVGSLAVRAGDEQLIPRWREACRYAFRTGGADDAPEAPALAIASGAEGEAPAYSLRQTQARGHCEPPTDGTPLWMCGVANWQGPGDEDLKGDLMEFYTRTRWMEWRD